ncbi:sodium-dependent glucose transporter 1 [Plakobranchus ocellatus]|uniref:Sodium-dependent glucose transporter 1 n=1 Tax=Plakobranchus ocellatus TaxID=259542 RepID=A0AAV3ZWG7_9GAST|nr:sodium-dependent glucose transporter 1 [Plakobranchus ocellatus]
MMEEEEETVFDQENLLGHSDETSKEKTELKRKLSKTGALAMAFFCLGLCIAIPGPTLLDLGRMVGRDTQHMVLVFTARSLGYLLGSVAGGVLGDIWDQQLLLGLTLGATAVATAGIPWCTALLSMAVLIAVHGVAIGVLDSGGNVFCIRIWGKQSPSYMQLLHFAFGIGAFLAPLIARPFLGNTVTSIGVNDSVGLPYTFEIQALNSIPVTVTGKNDMGEKSNIKNVRSARDLSLFGKTGIFADVPSSSWSASLSSAWIGHRNRREGAETPQESFKIADTPAINNDTHTKTGVSVLSSTTNGTIISDDNPSITTTKSAAPPQSLPKKPTVINGGHFNPKHADGELNNAKLVDIIHNPPKGLPSDGAAPEAASPVTSTAASVPHTTVNWTFENSTQKNDSNSNVSAADEEVATNNERKVGNLKSTSPPTGDSSSQMLTRHDSPVTSTDSTTASTTTFSSTIHATTTPKTTTTQSTITTKLTDVSISTPVGDKDAQSPISPLHPENGVAQHGTVFIGTDSTTPNTTANMTTTGQDTLQFFFETVRNMSKIQFAYLVIGLLLAANTFIFFSLYCKDRAAQLSGPLTTPLSHEDLTRPPKSNCFVFIFLGMLFLFFFTYVGMEVTYGGLLPTFALDFPGVINSPAQGATLVALFWGSLAGGRGVAIFLAHWFKPPCMMVFDLSLTLAGAIVLVAGISANPKLLWVGTVTLGLGMSSLFPTAMSWAHCYYPLSGRAAAVFVAGCGVGEMTVPAITGQLYHNVSHMALMYVILGLASFLVLLFIVLQVLAFYSSKGYGNKFGGAPRSHSGFIRLESSEDMADALDMGLVEETVLGGEDSMMDIPQGRVEDLTSVTRRKRGNEKELRARRQNGNVESMDGHEVTEFSKLVELSD